MEGPVTLVARRDIRPVNEITINYALFEASEEFVCDSFVCRKQITGRDWRLPELQQRYAGHWLPLIERRIAR
jgi:hypothetical protein